MRKIRFILAAVMTAMAIFPISAANASDISVVVNGEKIKMDTPAVITDNRTLVPLRAVSEALGCDIAWDGEVRGITLTDGESLYFTWIDKNYGFKTSGAAIKESFYMDVAPQIMNDYTMVPVRAIAEIFGAKVDWNGAAQTVTVECSKSSVEEGLAAEFKEYGKRLLGDYSSYTAFAANTKDANIINAQLELENGGKITLNLYPDIAPITVENFVSLAKSGFYDGLVFHRVIKDFMVQGGGFDKDMKQKEANSIRGEFLSNSWFNMLPHNRGVISMARTAVSNDSASSQFFIMHSDTASLNGQYAAFGVVTSGMEYVDAIANTATETVESLGMEDVPAKAQVIKTIKIIE